MEFLLQFQVKADEVYYNDPIEFKLKDMELTLYFDDNVNWISKGKKAHIVVNAANREEAYKSISARMKDFNNRLIFLTGENIIISHLEFIIHDQTGEDVRDIFFRDLKMPGIHELNMDRIYAHKKFLYKVIPDDQVLAIRFFNQAVLAESAQEKFRCLFLALEALVGTEIIEAGCDSHGCGGILICSKCSKTKKYPRVTTKRLQNFIDSTGFSKKFEAGKLTASKLVVLRGKLSHASTGKKKIKPVDIDGINHSLSLLIRWYLEEKYDIWPGGSVVKYGRVAGIEKQFKTKVKTARFALDIPPISELFEHTQDTRWFL